MAHVYKSKPVEILDQFFSREADLTFAYEYADQVLDDLEGEPLWRTTERLGADDTGLTPVGEETDFFRETWFDGPSAPPGVDAIMRTAYRRAIQLATEDEGNPKPLETFWVTGAGNDFEMHVCATDDHVTVFVLIPLPRPYPGSHNANSRSFAFRAEKAAGVDIEQVSGPEAGS